MYKLPRGIYNVYVLGQLGSVVGTSQGGTGGISFRNRFRPFVHLEHHVEATGVVGVFQSGAERRVLDVGRYPAKSTVPSLVLLRFIAAFGIIIRVAAD